MSRDPEMGSAKSPIICRNRLRPSRFPINKNITEQMLVAAAAGARVSPAMLALSPMPRLFADRERLKNRTSGRVKHGEGSAAEVRTGVFCSG